ncbi:unnamed protein product [Effrenium voratum]|uniref:ABC transporter domain-containing protein n=1 Tax=Effrenium voratum TaxID=2562239 RepID=A0AA36NG07_9DINO|nr:unnamed protein product [Effrenium voratum]CAJ1423213.1 unnamed protein product [Effrenium voratum]
MVHENDVDIIQFASTVLYCSEAEGKVEVSVVRLGEEDNTCSVCYETSDISAAAGVKYHRACGTMTFEPGQFMKNISVELICNNAFEATLEFSMRLYDAKGAVLGTEDTCRILIADDDTFPTNRFHTFLSQGQMSRINGGALMLEYFKMAFSDRALRRAAFWNCLTDQYANVSFVWHIFLNRVLVDSVLAPTPQDDSWYSGALPTSRTGRAILLVVLFLLPHGFIIFLYRLKAQRKILGMAVNQLQENLLRKYLNYNETSRHAVSVADLTMAITRDVPELISEGFMSLFDLIEGMGLVLILGVTTLAGSHDAADLILSLTLFILLPLGMMIFIRCRHAKTERIEHHLFVCQTETLSLIQQITQNFRLITDYWQQPSMVKSFGGRVRSTNKASTEALVRKIENTEFAPFLTTVAVCTYIVFNFQKVADDVLPLGVFLATVTTWKGVGSAYQRAYKDMLSMQHALAPLRNIVHYMNLPVDTSERMEMSRWQLSRFSEASPEAQRQLFQGVPSQSELLEPGRLVRRGKLKEEAVYPQDLFRICATNISFAYPEHTGGGSNILYRTSFQIPQGTLVAITGPRGSGKKTVLELVAGVLLPASGSRLFVPPHLRVLHVAKDPQSLPELDLFSNVIFGTSARESRLSTRVMKICNRLGLDPEVRKMVEQAAMDYVTEASEKTKEKAHGPTREGSAASVVARAMQNKLVRGMHSFPFTEQCLLNLCRAFILNPEVLVLHKPLENFGRLHGRRIVDLLREFVDNRGLEQAPQELHLRRPRTVIMSADGCDFLDSMDILLSVDDGSVSELSLAALAHVRKEVTKLFYGLDVKGDGLLRVKDFTRISEVWPQYQGLFGVPETAEPQEATQILALLFAEIDGGANGGLDIDEMMEYMVASFGRDVQKLEQALKNPEGVLIHKASYANAKRSNTMPLDAWAAPDIPTDSPIPVQRFGPPTRRPG